MKKFSIIFLLLLSACVENPGYGKTPLYRDISGMNRPDGQLWMVQANCRNAVNSYARPYEGPTGTYITSQAGASLNYGLNAIARGMSGPGYEDCMLSQGYQLAGWE